MPTTTRRPWLYRAEWAACALSVAGFIATLIEPQWIELAFGESPDGGDGSAERWLLGAAFVIAASIAAVLARRERRRDRLSHAR